MMSSKLQQLPCEPCLLQDISFSLSVLERLSKLFNKKPTWKFFWQCTPFKVLFLSVACCNTNPSSDFYLKAQPRMGRTHVGYFPLIGQKVFEMPRLWAWWFWSRLGKRLKVIQGWDLDKRCFILKTFCRSLLCLLVVSSFILSFFPHSPNPMNYYSGHAFVSRVCRTAALMGCWSSAWDPREGLATRGSPI